MLFRYPPNHVHLFWLSDTKAVRVSPPCFWTLMQMMLNSKASWRSSAWGRVVFPLKSSQSQTQPFSSHVAYCNRTCVIHWNSKTDQACYMFAASKKGHVLCRHYMELARLKGEVSRRHVLQNWFGSTEGSMCVFKVTYGEIPGFV